MNRDIPALTGLRGVAALWVFAYHSASVYGPSEWIKVISAAGFLGVDVFFVLSGFVLALNYSHLNLITRPSEYTRFLWKRLARIYPVHLAALALLCVLVVSFAAAGIQFIGADRLTLSGLVSTLTLTHAWSMPMTKTWNTVSWSISAEWAAYIAFPLIAACANRMRSPAMALCSIAALFLALAHVVQSTNIQGSMSLGMPRIAAEFTAGVLLYRLWQLRSYRSSKAADLLAVVCLVVLILGSGYVSRNISNFAAMLYFPVVACSLVYAVAASNGILSHLLSSRAALFGGKVSFSFYMVHLLVLIACKLSLPFSGIVGTSIALAVTIAVSTFMLLAVEEPARRWMINHIPLGSHDDGLKITTKNAKILCPRKWPVL